MTDFEQPPTTPPVSFDPPQPPAARRGRGIWIVAAAALVVVGGAAVALAAEDDNTDATAVEPGDPEPVVVSEPAGDESPARPSDDEDQDDQQDQADDRPDSGGAPPEPDEPGEERSDPDVDGQIVIEDGDGRTVIDLGELDPDQIAECMGWPLLPGLPPFGEFDAGDLGPMLDELGPMFQEFDFDDLGPLWDRFDDLEQIDPPTSEQLDDVDLDALFSELGIESLEDLDLETLLEVLGQLDLGPLFRQFEQFEGGPGLASPGGPWFGQSDDEPVLPPLLPGMIEDCFPVAPGG